MVSSLGAFPCVCSRVLACAVDHMYCCKIVGHCADTRSLGSSAQDEQSIRAISASRRLRSQSTRIVQLLGCLVKFMYRSEPKESQLQQAVATSTGLVEARQRRSDNAEFTTKAISVQEDAWQDACRNRLVSTSHHHHVTLKQEQHLLIQ